MDMDLDKFDKRMEEHFKWFFDSSNMTLKYNLF